ncbi:hypothetical protein B296_00026938 [Ensete ventricosum]|uniref:Uncharacterized protein n=1 Tax=Ensete ventricosum TaxID=4639 RepID=A0A427AI71_ENSVE|nr:hypothetical protein B296_00026938 [Ensete ventricosum]
MSQERPTSNPNTEHPGGSTMSSHQPCSRSVKLPAYRRKKRARYYPHRIVTGGCSMTRGLLPQIPDSLPSRRASHRNNQSVSRSHPTNPNADWDDPSHCPLHPSTGPSVDAPASACPSADVAVGSTPVKVVPRRTPRRSTPPPGRSHDREPERLGESTDEPLPRCYASPARAGCCFLRLNQLGEGTTSPSQLEA